MSMAFQYTNAFVTLAAADTETLVQFYAQLLEQEPKPYIPNVYAPPGEITTASHGREIYAYDPNSNRLILHESNNTNSQFVGNS
jgi:hypothetical protein